MSIYWQQFQSMFYRLFGKSYTCGCGHIAKKKTKLTVDGVSGVFVLSPNHEYCSKCWLKASIKCAWCKRTIKPGDAITLYHPAKPGFVIPKHAVQYGPPREGYSHGALVGCLGWECADSGADRAGFWVMPGKVQRALSPIEMLMCGDPQVEVVACNDLSDPSKAVLIEEKFE